MKSPLLVTVAIFSLVGTTTQSFAGTKDYKLICESPKLKSAEKSDCKAQFEAAETDAERASVFHVFDYLIAGFAPDGTRLSKADKAAPAMADAQK